MRNVKGKGKDKGHPRTGYEVPEGEYRYSSTLSLTSALDVVKVSVTHRPLYLWERPGIHCTGGWVRLRAGLVGFGIISPPPGFDPWTVQPVASLYNFGAILSPMSDVTV